MGKFKAFNLFFSLFIVISLSVFCFTGCMQVVPEVAETDTSVIFEYSDEEKPNVRLSVFAHSLSDVRRYDNLELSCEGSDFCWETSDLAIISDGNYDWVGNTNFIVPEGYIIPTGIYEMTFINADGESESINVKIDYDEKYYSLNQVQAEEEAKKDGGRKRIAIYNYDKILVYFGQQTENLKTEFNIREVYRDAKYYQYVYLVPSKGVVCILKEIEMED